MFKPSLEEVLSRMKEEFQYLTLTYPLELDRDKWFLVYEEISRREIYHLIFESGRVGRYSVIAYRPTHHLVGKNNKLFIHHLSSNGEIKHSEHVAGKLLTLLKTWMQDKQTPYFENLPDMSGGLFGFFSYDLVREQENLPERSVDDLQTPDINIMVFDRLIVYDHDQQQHWLILNQKVDVQEAYMQEMLKNLPVKHSIKKDHQTKFMTRKDQITAAYHCAQQRLKAWNTELQSLIAEAQKPITNQEDVHKPLNGAHQIHALESVTPSFSEEEFVQAVQRVQAYIAAGDVFQVNLSVRQSRPLQVAPLEVYKQLRTINPSPYMGYIQFPDLQVISGSPEQLIKLKGTELSTRPIAGTRPRGSNREQDLQLARELIQHEKERAEHVMLVDLERNDLGKVATYGSVQVNEFMVIEEYSHVMHIVSNVKGELAPNKDAFDVIEAVFPGGTITGAPKVRTMEIIEELEPVRRGLYTGSIGWINFNGAMELNIVIRTMVVQNDKVYVQAGAGIVIDSVPELEYQESLNKARALWKAYELSVAAEQQKQHQMR